jgi:uncharacterized damage-inducible protein DinB
MFIFEALVQTRQNALKVAKQLSTEQINRIPAGHSNNIIWHIGHMMASQQVLCYIRSGAPARIPNALIEKFRKGTSPADWTSATLLSDLETLFIETATVFEADYKAGLLSNYEEYATSSGIVLSTIDEAVAYSYGHENLHYGNILTLVKSVR